MQIPGIEKVLRIWIQKIKKQSLYLTIKVRLRKQGNEAAFSGSLYALKVLFYISNEKGCFMCIWLAFSVNMERN